jgi:hypothetical protein
VGETSKRADRRCQTKGCKRPYRAKSYCNVHYKQWRQGKLGKGRYKICSKEECLQKRHEAGLCETHFKEWRASRGKGGADEEKTEAA